MSGATGGSHAGHLYGEAAERSARRQPSSLDPGKPPDTRTRLLDAAEQLFALGGIEATSLRQITAAARANVAAVSYYFGSRHGLIAEVFARRLGPLNDERLRRLTDAEERAGQDGASLEEILDALLAPALRLRETRGAALVRLLGRAHSEPSEEVREIVFSQFGPVFRRFHRALARTLPHLSDPEVTCRLMYAVGAMAFAMAAPPAVPGLGGSAAPREERTRLITFLAAGLRAPAAIDAAGPSERRGR